MNIYFQLVSRWSIARRDTSPHRYWYWRSVIIGSELSDSRGKNALIAPFARTWQYVLRIWWALILLWPLTHFTRLPYLLTTSKTKNLTTKVKNTRKNDQSIVCFSWLHQTKALLIPSRPQPQVPIKPRNGTTVIAGHRVQTFCVSIRQQVVGLDTKTELFFVYPYCAV